MTTIRKQMIQTDAAHIHGRLQGGTGDGVSPSITHFSHDLPEGSRLLGKHHKQDYIKSLTGSAEILRFLLGAPFFRPPDLET